MPAFYIKSSLMPKPFPIYTVHELKVKIILLSVCCRAFIFTSSDLQKSNKWYV